MTQLTSKSPASAIRQRVPALAALLLFIAPAAFSQVVMNELLYRPDPASANPLKAHQWVELYNKGTVPADLAGWKIANRAGSAAASARALPSVSLAPGAYLVVHFTSGTSTPSDVYTQDTTPLWDPAMDEAALYSPSAIVDFISWSSRAAIYTPGTAHDAAVAARIWTAGVSLATDGIQVESYERPRPVVPGMSVGRDPASADTNVTADFEPHGGIRALDNSPGRQNLSAFTVNQVQPAAGTADSPRSVRPAAAPKRKWTVLLYFNGDNSLDAYIHGNIREIQTAGGSTDDVNYVVMYDGGGLKPTYRGRILKDPPPPALVDPNSITLEAVPGEETNIGERNMGDPGQLSAFIAWAKTNFPADRYALILSAHGDDWKSWGPDDSSRGTYNADFLYMGELRTALAGQHFDLMGFDACLMAGIEVAYQLREFTDYLVASEQTIPGLGFPYDTFSTNLNLNPAWTGVDLGREIVSQYARRYNAEKNWTLSLIEESKIRPLSSLVDTWAVKLRGGSALFRGRNDPLDNIQVLLKRQRAAATQFTNDYVDLADLAERIDGDPRLDCVKSPLLFDEVLKAVVVSVHSTDFPDAHGIHIYFPRYRKSSPESFDDYDLPFTRATDGSSRLAVYAPNHDQLPLQARDRQDLGPLNPRTEWPQPPGHH